MVFHVGSMEMPSLNRSMAPLQEYLLQGSILDKHRGPFLHRLNGLCDVVSEMPEKFHDHEMVYHLSKLNIQIQQPCLSSQLPSSL